METEGSVERGTSIATHAPRSLNFFSRCLKERKKEKKEIRREKRKRVEKW
jgi:hypothetical protein